MTEAQHTADHCPPSPQAFSLRRVAMAVGAALALGAVTAFGVAPESELALPPVNLVVEPVALALPAAAAEPGPAATLRFHQAEVINRGETLSSLLSRLGAADPELGRFIASNKIARRMLQLQSGRTVTAEIDDIGLVHRLQYRHGSLEAGGRGPMRVTIVRNGDSFLATEEVVAVERQIEMRSADVRSTLFAATDSAGIPEVIASRVADILDGSVDLRRDLRRGASLRVVYEMVREADSLEVSQPGKVLAFELVNGGKRHEAVWFEHEDGRGAYYNFAGQSLTRSFLREPLEFTRITSGFSGARLHPLFRDVRAHTGVDFAAPVGTKVRSVGDGVVESIGFQGGYGRMIVISHHGRVSTVYAHLNGFSDGLVKGARVSQGEVIGTVGMSGWSTGPHLHYEFRIAGRHVDPLQAVLPEGRKLSMADRMRFAPLSQAHQERMAQLESISLARFE